MTNLTSIDVQHFRVPLDAPASDPTHGIPPVFWGPIIFIAAVLL